MPERAETDRDSVQIEIAGECCEIRSASQSCLDSLGTRYQSHLTRGKEPSLVALFRPVAEAKSAAGGPVRTWQEQNRLRVERNDLHASIDLAAGRAEADIRPDVVAYDTFLRVALSFMLARASGLLIHAAGIARRGRAYVFFGPSGSGKTTIGRLAEPGTLLSDEVVAIRRVGDSYRAYGTPFWGDLAVGGLNRSYPIAGMYRLMKDKQAYLENLAGVSYLQELLRSVLLFDDEPSLARELFETVTDLSKRVPGYRLHFKRDDGFWDVVDQDRQQD